MNCKESVPVKTVMNKERLSCPVNAGLLCYELYLRNSFIIIDKGVLSL